MHVLLGCVCMDFHFFTSHACIGGHVCPLSIAAPEEPGGLFMHHQSLTHPQLQKWNPTDICKYMATENCFVSSVRTLFLIYWEGMCFHFSLYAYNHMHAHVCLKKVLSESDCIKAKEKEPCGVACICMSAWMCICWCITESVNVHVNNYCTCAFVSVCAHAFGYRWFTCWHARLCSFCSSYWC